MLAEFIVSKQAKNKIYSNADDNILREGVDEVGEVGIKQHRRCSFDADEFLVWVRSIVRDLENIFGFCPAKDTLQKFELNELDCGYGPKNSFNEPSKISIAVIIKPEIFNKQIQNFYRRY